MRSCAVRVTTFSNGSIILPSFKFMELYALTLAAHSYALLGVVMTFTTHAHSMKFEPKTMFSKETLN